MLEEKVREQMSAIHRAHEETILRLVSASRYRDEETGAHIKRTGLYCELFAEALKIAPRNTRVREALEAARGALQGTGPSVHSPAATNGGFR